MTATATRDGRTIEYRAGWVYQDTGLPVPDDGGLGLWIDAELEDATEALAAALVYVQRLTEVKDVLGCGGHDSKGQ